MATIILSSIGSALAGPLGGAIGSFIGQSIDQQILAPKMRGARLPDVDVQLSSYGNILPRLYGSLRVAGQLIWSTGLLETPYTTGGKSSGGRRTQYAYSSSFAIALSARRISRIARIWADGKLIAGSDGRLLGGGRLRVYSGSERQNPDPLIAAREGTSAPAYRGLAYVVFEDLPLADYANRIPNLTFEVEADARGVRIGDIVEDVARSCGVALRAPLDTALSGYAATRGQSIAQCIEGLLHFCPRASLTSFAALMQLRTTDATAQSLAPQWLGAQSVQSDKAQPDIRVSPALAPPQMISISYFDPARDYQPGIQSMVLRDGIASENIDLALPVVMSAAQARTLATRLYVRRLRESRQQRICLPLAGLRFEAGDIVRLADMSLWRVESWALESMVVELRLHSLDSSDFPVLQAETGRVHQADVTPLARTKLRIFETCNWRNISVAGPEIWVALTGETAHWRGAEIQYSSSHFAHWARTPFLDTPSAMGTARAALPSGAANMWDERQSLVIEMAHPALKLQTASLGDILDGHNLALLGEEIIAYRQAILVAAGVYRLQGLLRGLFASPVSAHGTGESFVALEEERLFCIQLPPSFIGRSLAFRAAGPGDQSEDSACEHLVQGTAMDPLAPVHVTIAPPVEDQSVPIPPTPVLVPLPKVEDPAPPKDPAPDPNPKTDPAPVITPKGDPEPVLTPKVDPTPTLTPKVDPTPKTDPAPVLTPKVDPTPVITPKVDPTPVVNPDPDPAPIIISKPKTPPKLVVDMNDIPSDLFSDKFDKKSDDVLPVLTDAPPACLRWSSAQNWRAGMDIDWIRRSRSGFLWLDGADAPEDEPQTLFHVGLRGDVAMAEWAGVRAPLRVAADILAAIASPAAQRLQLRIAQISPLLGAGTPHIVDILVKDKEYGG